MSAQDELVFSAGMGEVDPTRDEHLSPDLIHRFSSIIDDFHAIRSLENAVAMEAACSEMCGRIQLQVTAHPLLATTVARVGSTCWSLVTFICETTFYVQIHPAIKFLIEQNSRVWETGGEEAYNTLNAIASNHVHCVLMPWIAEHYGRVFDHPSCQRNPPHLGLAKIYGDGGCDASVIRRFYELYPQGLDQHNERREGGLPIHLCVAGEGRSDADLIKWMAQQSPDSLAQQCNIGRTPLHYACDSLVDYPSEKMAEICCFLAAECPKAVRMVSFDSGRLPIHLIVRRSNRPDVHTVVLALLREFPRSITMSTPRRPNPTPIMVPFIQCVEPVLQEELVLQKEIVVLTDTSTSWCEATRCSKDTLQVSVSNVFQTWATLRNAAFQQRLDQIPERIMKIRDDHEWEDVESDESGDDDDDSEEGGGEPDNDEEFGWPGMPEEARR